MIIQKNHISYMIACLFILSIFGCSQHNSDQSPIAISNDVTITPTDSSPPKHSPSSLPTSAPLHPAIIKIPAAKIGIVESPPISYSLPIVTPNLGLALSDQHVYWVDEESPRAIKRLSLQQPTTPEIVAQGIYTQGVISNIEVSSNNEWLVYWERVSHYIGGDWKAKALNLHTMDTYILFDSSGAPFETEPIPSLAFVTWGMGTEAVAIEYTLEADETDCQRIVTRIVDLATRQDQIVDETDCGREATILTRPVLAGGKLAAEMDHADVDGGGVDITLYDRRTQQMQQLTTDRKSLSPQISNQYVIWERIVPSLNTHYSNSIGVYDQSTKQQSIIEFPYEFSIPFLTNHWVYWPTSSQPLYLYNLKENAFVLVATTKNCYGSFRWVTMNGNIVAWIRSSGLLEWRAIDPSADDPYIGCEEIPV